MGKWLGAGQIDVLTAALLTVKSEVASVDTHTRETISESAMVRGNHRCCAPNRRRRSLDVPTRSNRWRLHGDMRLSRYGGLTRGRRAGHPNLYNGVRTNLQSKCREKTEMLNIVRMAMMRAGGLAILGALVVCHKASREP